MVNPTQTKPWKDLFDLAQEPAGDGVDIVLETDFIQVDFSKSFVSQDALASLIDLANEQKLTATRDGMFMGEKINLSEDRAVLHTALRRPESDTVMVDGRNVMPDIHGVLNRMKSFSDKIRAEGKITDIVHIGIGGSDLGPRMVCEALKHLKADINVHFVSNVDAADITETLRYLNSETTLFIIASKTFTTQETMMNAAYARDWFLQNTKDREVKDHFVALSTNEAAVTEFGISPDNMFAFWDWVGGRYSLWSAIGLPICLAYGYDVFRRLLNGAYNMDRHFEESNFTDNLPVMMGLIGIWHRNFKHSPAYAVLPYVQNLNRLSDYMQQLDMESNGKSVDRDGNPITEYQTGGIVFGQPGTNGQHAFHQWLHQGTQNILSVFVKVQNSPYDINHHKVLNAHAAAQAIALEKGVDRGAEVHRNCTGGKPSVTISMKDTSPESLGSLLALFEHTVFVQGVIWNINSFDQWGVELGKEIAKQILAKGI